MAEDFNSPEDILNEWINAGKKEQSEIDLSESAAMDLVVYLKGAGTETFHGVRFADVGSRLIVQDGDRLSVYPEASLLMYEAEPAEVEEDE